MATVFSVATNRLLRRSGLPTASNPPVPADPARASVPAQLEAPSLRPSLEETAPISISRVRVAEHPAAQHALAVLRNRQTETWEFRATSNQLLVLLAMEATRTLPLREQEVDTGMEPWMGRVLAKPVVFLPVTRDGLGLSHTVAESLPGIMVGGISLERIQGSKVFQPRLHLPNAPALGDCRVILFDPVISTGTAADVALSLVYRLGAVDVCLLSFMISTPGLHHLQAVYPELTVWTANIDGDWDGQQTPGPMLGNFRNRLFN